MLRLSVRRRADPASLASSAPQQASSLTEIYWVQVPDEAVPGAQRLAAEKLADFRAEYGLLEDQLSLAAMAGDDAAGDALAPESTERLVGALLALPHGVVKMSHAVAGDQHQLFGRLRHANSCADGCVLQVAPEELQARGEASS